MGSARGRAARLGTKNTAVKVGQYHAAKGHPIAHVIVYHRVAPYQGHVMCDRVGKIEDFGYLK